MEESTVSAKERLHTLIDELPESDLATAERVLCALRDTGGDPLLRMLEAAPADDEPLTDEDRAAHREGWEQYQRGQGRILEAPTPAKRGRIAR